jgi:hypothetical protein
MTGEEARQFKARWELAEEVMAEEIRRTPPSVKLRQVALMYEASRHLNWNDAPREEEKVRERWRVLRERYHA